MISAKRFLRIMTESDPQKRDAMIDKLTEEDAKYIIKTWLRAMRKGDDPCAGSIYR